MLIRVFATMAAISGAVLLLGCEDSKSAPTKSAPSASAKQGAKPKPKPKP